MARKIKGLDVHEETVLRVRKLYSRKKLQANLDEAIGRFWEAHDAHRAHGRWSTVMAAIILPLLVAMLWNPNFMLPMLFATIVGVAYNFREGAALRREQMAMQDALFWADALGYSDARLKDMLWNEQQE